MPPKVSTIEPFDLPAHTQLNNVLNPYGACNATCITAALRYLGIEIPQGIYEQPEDAVYAKLLDLGDPSGLHPGDVFLMQKVIEELGGISDSRMDLTWEEIDSHLKARKPVVVHTYLTSFGHIICLRGKTRKGYQVLDTYGEWHDYGYDLSVSPYTGVYSYELMDRVSRDEAGIWGHLIDKA